MGAAESIVALQRLVGNAAVASILGRAGHQPGVQTVAPNPGESREGHEVHLQRGSHNPRSPKGKSAGQVAKQTENVPGKLTDAVSIEQLFGLYATNEDSYVVGPLPPFNNPTYTRAWIRGAGQEAIRKEIIRRLEGVGEHERIRLLNYLDSMHPSLYDSARKLWLRDQVGARLLLTYEQRNRLRTVVGERMNAAFTEFCFAAQRNKTAIRDIANAEAAAAAFYIDIFLGFATPFLARSITQLFAKIPAEVGSDAYKKAMEAFAENRQLVTTTLLQVTKATKQLITTNAMPLFGEKDADVFINGLTSSFRTGIDTLITERIPTLTDQELGVLFGIYAPEVSNQDIYAQEISDLVAQFRDQVEPIGQSSVEEGVRLYNIRGRSGLALIMRDFSHIVGGAGGPLIFLRWITPDMEDIALAKHRKLFGDVETLDPSEVGRLPAKTH
jgi:hypothetical protein